MITPRTVSLEILRHGPPHNQLLSPLTNYLALCGNHSPASVQMPFEHSQLLNRLRVLRYEPGADDKQIRDHHLQDMAAMVGRDILGRIPGLIAEMCDVVNPGCDCNGENFTHLRLIVSASELALIPFELAIAPEGLPGAGQSLLLQSQAPLCLTREVRRVSHATVRWPNKPKILFAAASPGGGQIPFAAHLLALRKSIDPWVTNIDPNVDDEVRMREHLVVLSNASIDSIREACAQNDFSHVHILAHGANYMDADDKRFGIALHSDTMADGVDVVDGVRLAAALRTCPTIGSSRVSSPAVVTIASCDGGNVGSVMGTGASVAHALHENGIPLVVASQFPLTFDGSVILTEVVYNGLLWGTDPRRVLFCLRRDLRAKLSHSHDWSSVVAYAAFPNDLASQLSRARMIQANECVSAGFNIQDRLDATAQQDHQYWEDSAVQRIQKGIEVLNDHLRNAGHDPLSQQIRLLGMLASAEKRSAEYLFRRARKGESSGSNRTRTTNQTRVTKQLLVEVAKKLEQARDRYDEAFRRNRCCDWALVQSLSLTAILEGPAAVNSERWQLAESMSRSEVSNPEDLQQGWALGNLIELHLLKLVMSEKAAEVQAAKAAAIDSSKQLAEFGRNTFVYTQRRQINRYLVWFADFQKAIGASDAFAKADFQNVVKKILEILPNHADVDWS